MLKAVSTTYVSQTANGKYSTALSLRPGAQGSYEPEPWRCHILSYKYWYAKLTSLCKDKRNLQLIDLERFSLLALMFCEITNKLTYV